MWSPADAVLGDELIRSDAAVSGPQLIALIETEPATVNGVIAHLLRQCTIGEKDSAQLRHGEKVLQMCDWISASGPPTAFRDEMQSRFPSPPKCETVWTGDHIAFRCRTCGTSESSCMCVECFDPAEHEGHDYRIYRCSSGGCCDCGDPQAWKPSGFCKRHRVAPGNAPQGMDALDATTIRALSLVVRAVLRELCISLRLCSTPDIGLQCIDWCKRMVEWLHDLIGVCPPLRATVAKLLLEPFDCTDLGTVVYQTQTIHLTEICEKVRCNICENSAPNMPPWLALFKLACAEEGCATHIRDMCEDVGIITFLDMLLFDGVMHGVELCDTFGMFWLKLLFDARFKLAYSAHFCHHYGRFVEMLVDESVDTSPIQTFLDRIFCQLFHNPESVQSLVFDGAMLGTAVQKLSALLHRVSKDAINGAHNRRLLVLDCEHRIIQRQVYSRLANDVRTLLGHESVARRALCEHGGALYRNFLEILLLMQGMDVQRRQRRFHVEFESISWQPAFIVDNEMNTISSAMLTGVDALLRDASISDGGSGFSAVLQGVLKPILRCLHGWLCTVAPRKREGSRDLGSTEGSIADQLVAAMQEVERSAMEADSCVTVQSDSAATEHDGAGGDDVTALVHSFDASLVSVDHVSFHIPLTRFCCAVLCLAARYAPVGGDFNVCTPLCTSRSPVSPALVMEHPLRTLVLASQIGAKLWVRNGLCMFHQLSFYYNKYWYDTGLDNDIFALQYGALGLGGNEFMSRLLRRFEIDTEDGPFVLDALKRSQQGDDAGVQEAAAHSDVGTETAIVDLWNTSKEKLERPFSSLTALPRALTAFQLTVAEDFLKLVLQVVVERTRVESPEAVDPRRELRREMIHWLATGTTQSSALTQKICNRVAEHSAFDDVLHEVASADDDEAGAGDAMETNLDGQGKFMLRKECWSEVDRYFLHYTRMDEQQMLITRRTRGDVVPALPPLIPLPRAPCAAFHSLPHTILHCCELHKIIFVVLHNSALAISHARWTDRLLRTALDLLSLSLQLGGACPFVLEQKSCDASPGPNLARHRKDWQFLGDNPFQNACTIVHAAPASVLVANSGCSMVHLLLLLSRLAATATMDDSSTDNTRPTISAILRLLEHGDERCAAHVKAAEMQVDKKYGGNKSIERKSTAPGGDMVTVAGAARLSDDTKRRETQRSRQSAIMEQMRRKQQQALAALGSSSDSDSDVELEENNKQSDDMEHGGNMVVEPLASVTPAQGAPACAHSMSNEAPPNTKSTNMAEDNEGHIECVMCHERCVHGEGRRPFGFVGFIASNTVLNTHERRVFGSSSAAYKRSSEVWLAADSLYSGGAGVWQMQYSRHPQLLCCGHALHHECFVTYFDSNVEKRARQFRHYDDDFTEDTKRGEFICPICRRISNILVPVLPTQSFPLACEVLSPMSRPSSGALYDDFVRWLDQQTSAVSLPINWLVKGQGCPLSKECIAPVAAFCGFLVMSCIQGTSFTSFGQQSDGKWSARESAALQFSISDPQCVLSLPQILAANVSLIELNSRYTAAKSSLGTPPDNSVALQLLTRSFFELLASRLPQESGDEMIDTCAFQAHEVEVEDLLAVLWRGTLPKLEAADGAGSRKYAGCRLPSWSHRYRAATGAMHHHRFGQPPLPLLRRDLFTVLVRTLMFSGEATSLLASPESLREKSWRYFMLLLPAAVAQAVLSLTITTPSSCGDASASASSYDDCSTPSCSVAPASSTELLTLVGASDTAFVERIEILILPFLRKVKILLCTCLGWKLRVPQCSTSTACEAHALLAELGALSVSETLRTAPGSLNTLLDSWLDHFHEDTAERMSSNMGEMQSAIRLQPLLLQPEPFSLVALPKTYTELFCRRAPCVRCGREPEQPALCLLCGQVFCSFKGCRDESGNDAAMVHSAECGAGYCAFLLLRACTVMCVMPGNRRCHWGSLYLDHNGEEDPNMRRGKMLYLSQARLVQLTKLVSEIGFCHNNRLLSRMIHNQA